MASDSSSVSRDDLIWLRLLVENVISNFNLKISDEIMAEDLNEIHRRLVAMTTRS